jgi:hypothetical protein
MQLKRNGTTCGAEGRRGLNLRALNVLDYRNSWFHLNRLLELAESLRPLLTIDQHQSPQLGQDLYSNKSKI